MRERSARDGHVHAPSRYGATVVAWLADIIEGLVFAFTSYAKDVCQSNLNPADLLDRRLRAARFVFACPEANQRYLQARTSTAIHRLYHVPNVTFVHLPAERPRPAIPSGGVRKLAAGRLVHMKGFDARDPSDGQRRRIADWRHPTAGGARQ